MKFNQKKWYAQTAEAVCQALSTSCKQGLTEAEAQNRLASYGANQLQEGKKKTKIRMFFDQFADFMILILIAAALLAGILGELRDAVVIITIVVLNAILGFSQEYRAEQAMAALKKLAAVSATVIRDGMVKVIDTAGIVPGDIILLEAGDGVPADARLLESTAFKVNESALTGESSPVDKTKAELPDANSSLAERHNLVYKGTFAVAGQATAVVVATGMQTELGRIAQMLEDETGVKTPLQKRLNVFSKKLAVGILFICGIVFVVGWLQDNPPLDMFLTAVSLAVAAIPESLPAVVTIALAFGAKKMVAQNALVRRLAAVEALGSITYICTDKTGTLTQNKMTVETVWCSNQFCQTEDCVVQRPEEPLAQLLTVMAISNNVRFADDGEIGDPTEIALLEAAALKGFLKQDLEKKYPRLAEIPFDSERKLMTTFHQWTDGKVLSITKGAPEKILTVSTQLMAASCPAVLESDVILKANEAMAETGLRALGFAVRVWDFLPADISAENSENALVFLGIAGLLDPLREEARAAVSDCRLAGIKPVMITGDHPATARSIAQRAGILDLSFHPDEIITGSELEDMSWSEFEKRAESVRVYARAAPEQKLKIVRALQERGHFVAMTGDGVNDAPALKRSDIGVAMGITGTDVAKEASHIILLDDNFATIVKAVKEGRRIFDNIRKFIKYTMASNMGEILTIFSAPFFGLEIPLLPIHLLWINLVTDGLPGLALAAEPGEKNLMRRPPRHPRESVFAQGLGSHIVWVGILVGATAVGTQAYFARVVVSDNWQTIVFTVLCLSQMGHVLAVRSETESFFRQGLISNLPLLGAVILTAALQMMIIYVPFFHDIFKTKSLTFKELLTALLISTLIFIAVEIEKLFKRIKRRKNWF